MRYIVTPVDVEPFAEAVRQLGQGPRRGKAAGRVLRNEPPRLE